LLSLDLPGERNSYFIDVTNIYITKEPISEETRTSKETVSGEELQKNRQKIYGT
jgi:hypothetical protein